LRIAAQRAAPINRPAAVTHNILPPVIGCTHRRRACASFKLLVNKSGGRAVRAEDLLPDNVNQGDFNGVQVRKGTVGAFLANARVLTDPAASAEARQIAERDLVEGLPALRALGLFEVLQIRDETLRALVDSHGA
jgi:hypothetical protein